MVLIIIILIYIMIIFFDYLPTIKTGPKKLIVLYTAMLTISFVVIILQNYNLTKPFISDFIFQTVQQIFNVQ